MQPKNSNKENTRTNKQKIKRELNQLRLFMFNGEFPKLYTDLIIITNYMALVRERTIQPLRPPLATEVSANFGG
jgi:hypothetical protein